MESLRSHCRLKALLFTLLFGACASSPGQAGSDSGGATDTAVATDATDTTIGDGADGQSEDAGLPPCLPGLPCDDENDCTLDDQCDAGICRGTEYTCDDKRLCTLNQCDGVGGCLFPVQAGKCLIFNECRTQGDPNPLNACERCDTDLNTLGWSPKADDAPCEDGNPCTFADYCKKGDCRKGLKSTCDDGNDCTADTCDSLQGCINSAASGACDDGNPCTPASVCSGGVCQPTNESCDDNNPCTTDTCLPDLGCAHVPFEGPCEDGNACTSNDLCINSVCEPGDTLWCDDDTPCTEDHCDAVFGCYHTLILNPCCSGALHLCNDDNPCTADSCDAGLNCTNVPIAGACDDDNPCTIDDQCNDDVCEGGASNTCDDGNPCTADSCNEAVGCQNAVILGSCDDGIECTTGDTCLAGVCIGDTSDCACEPDFDGSILRTTSLALGEKGEPGQGLDLDVNPSTCAPSGQCSDGIDNALSPIAGLANPPLEDALSSADANLLFEFIDIKTDGQPFTLALYPADWVKESCNNPTTDWCDYKVEKDAVNENCEPLIVLDNATIENNTLRAGGPNYSFPLNIPLFGDEPFAVYLYYGTVQADITMVGNVVTSMKNGLIGGAVKKSVFSTALEMMDPSELPLPKENVVQLIDLILKEDMDTESPPGVDAISAGFQFEAIPANAVGLDD